MFARFSKFETRLDNPNWGGTIAVPSDNGGDNGCAERRSGRSVHRSVPARPSTSVLDRATSRTITLQLGRRCSQDVWAGFWPNGWYKNVLSPTQGIYYPNFNFTGNGAASTGIGSWWLVHGRSHNPTVNVTHDRGIHHMKFGWQLRYSYDQDNASSGTRQSKFQLHRYLGNLSSAMMPRNRATCTHRPCWVC